ncbi:MAG: hypothetical protein J0H88_16445 [Sphingomonadales bacterium]|nr:hypothetical protein [Sphingomonadales bacterium]
MTPQQKIKHLILIRHAEWNDDPDAVEFTRALDATGIDDQYAALEEAGDIWDAVSEIRGGEVPSNLKCDWSRHYESQAVAARYIDGSWVGWTYWFGGGKHGEPETIDWIPDAYALDVTEEEKVVTVRTFAKADQAGNA